MILIPKNINCNHLFDLCCNYHSTMIITIAIIFLMTVIFKMISFFFFGSLKLGTEEWWGPDHNVLSSFSWNFGGV